MSGWRKRQIKDQEAKNTELWSIKWSQPYEFRKHTSLNEILDEFALVSSEMQEAKELIARIKSQL